MRNKPRIRFKGFTEDWEQRKLGECVDISTGYPFDSQDFNENGEYLVITNGNIQENTSFVLNNVGNRIDLDDRLKKYILDIDDLLITMDGTVGRVAIVVDNKLVLAQRVCRIKSNEPYYIYQLLSKNDFIQSMNKISHGGTIKHISLSEISEYQAFYPKSQKERIKISSVLINYDKLITLHQRKLEKLKLAKKALLQKLFPKNGSKFPELRFKGFADAWEQRKLGNLTQLITKGTTPKVKNIQNGINFIKVENISDDGVISINSYVSEEEHMNYLSRSILANNDILFSIAGTLGRTAIVKSHLLPANTNQALAIIRLNKSVDVEYINTFLKSNTIKTYIRKNPTVGAQPNLSLGQVSDLEINIPNYSEQKKISNLFSKFDLMITLHQCKLDKLQDMKKGLLQKMFV